MTISSIRCHLWKSTQARPVRFIAQFSALESSFDTPTAWAGEHVLAPPFFILNSETFPDILFTDKQLSWSKWLFIYFFWKKVWYYNKMNETLITWEANSHLPSRCPPHLGTNGQIFQESNCPQHELQDQINVSQDFSVGISQRTSEFTPSQRQSFHSPAGTRLARFKHDLSQVMGS